MKIRAWSLAFLGLVTVLLLAGWQAPPSWPAPQVTVQETGVYTENFTAYTAKDYTADTVWDPWDGNLRLGRSDAISQDSAAVAVGANSYTYVAWADSRSPNQRNIYLQRLDPNGNRLWAEDRQVNNIAGGMTFSSPAVATDNNSGSAIVVWGVYSDSRKGDIYAQRVNADGTRLWTQDLRVNATQGITATFDSSYVPAAAMDSDGNTIIVWEHDGEIYAQRININGQRLWAEDFWVDSGSEPSVAFDHEGNVLITWGKRYSPVTQDIYAQRINMNGVRLWATSVQVNKTQGVALWRCRPGIAVDDYGNAVIAWTDERDGYTKHSLYAQKIDTDGHQLWGEDVRVSKGYTGSPDVVIDANGNAIIAWEVYAQRLDANGNLVWGQNLRVGESDRRTISAMVWDSSRSNAILMLAGDDLVMQRLDAAGNRLWAAEARVNFDGGTASQASPVVATDESGNTILVWVDDRNGNDDIYTQRIDTTGNRLWISDVRVNSDPGAARQDSPAVAVDGDGNAIIVWQDARNGNYDIYAQKIDGSGNRLWVSDVRVDSDMGIALQDIPAIAMDKAGNAVIAWRDGRNQGLFADIYAQKLDANGNRLWGADARVNSSNVGVSNWSLAVAVDRNRNAFVVWTGYNSGYDIYAQKIDASGGRLWPADVRVNSDADTLTYQRSPAMVVDGNGNAAVVVWQDGRNSGSWDIYAQKIDTGGSRLWAADVRVNSDTGTANHYTPAIMVDENGNATAVWQDNRSGGYDIYAQKIDTSGNRLWGADARINSDTGTASQADPVVAVDGSGNAVVVWQDYRNGNADLYAQRINTVGGKAWLADLQVVYPDAFYLPTGTAQSRTVDTLSGNLAAATLTADYALNGGAVQFYLTNDGGTTWAAVTPGVTHVFTTTGSDLRWRAVLTGDPIWRRRTPVVNRLRIEYSTQVPYADAYEPDDTCAQARPIASNGAAQAHTFHQAGDADWVWFEVVSGTTYIVETYNVGVQANTVAEPHANCTAPPAGTGRSFGNGYTFSFIAGQTGRYYVKVYNHASAVYGQNTDYTLSVRVLRPSALALIVAGHDSDYSEQTSINYAADRAYRVFLNAGLGKANVRYLAPQPNRDVDGNGAPDDIAGLPTPANVREAIQGWARERGVGLGVPLYVYLVDHGLEDRFKADGDVLTSQVTAADLNLWLSNLEATTGADNINVIIDACYSGSFIDVTAAGPASLSGRNRVVIASTTSSWLAWGPPGGQGLYFSNAFFSALENEQSLLASFLAAREAVVAERQEQLPWLDDDGDQQPTSLDGGVAAERALRRVALGGQSPRVEWLRVNDHRIQAEVVDDSAWVGVKVEVFAPSYVPPAPDGSGTTRIVEVPVVVLTDAEGDGVYEGTYTFTEAGSYRLVAHTEDAEGNLGMPVVAFTTCQVYLPLVIRNR